MSGGLVTEVLPRVIDAYRFPPKLQPGCQHQLGCKCDPPFWLRASSPAEEEREKALQPPAKTGGVT